MNDLQIDACLEMILYAAGSSLRHYEQYTKDKLRVEMRKVEAIALATSKEASHDARRL